MDFNTYLNKAWNDHAADATSVADTFPEGLKLVQTASDLEQLGRLATHVYGEHLGKWNDGLSFINTLSQHSQFLPNSLVEKSFSIFKGSLSLSAQPTFDLKSYSVSDQIRILAMSASSLSEQGQSDKAKDYFLKALELGQSGISKEDPANRSLAITGNNLACSLEEKTTRNDKETDLMILAAQVARKFWEIAGTWKEVERAEYRLSQSYLKAAKIEESFVHAQNCVEICSENSAPALEFFFSYEALALAEKAKGNDIGYKTAVAQVKKYFEQLSADDKSWCEATFKKITDL